MLHAIALIAANKPPFIYLVHICLRLNHACLETYCNVVDFPKTSRRSMSLHQYLNELNSSENMLRLLATAQAFHASPICYIINKEVFEGEVDDLEEANLVLILLVNHCLPVGTLACV